MPRRAEGGTADAPVSSIARPATSTAPVVVVHDLKKRYKKTDRFAVDGVSFEVGRGQSFALLGPNGAGKTTTIQILTTTLLASGGTAAVGGRDVMREPSEVRRRIGFISQRTSLDLNLTAEENVRFHAVVYGIFPYRPLRRMMPAAYHERLEELAALMGLEGEMGTPVRRMSEGMRRKLEIVRSLMHRPEVLFLDEPTAGLDVASRRNLWRYLLHLQREHGLTLFLTTHYLEEAEKADRVCIIHRGRVVAQGSPAEIKHELSVETLIVDAPDRDALRSELRRLGIDAVETDVFEVSVGERSVHELLKLIQTPLSVVVTRSSSLEEAYLVLTESADDE